MKSVVTFPPWLHRPLGGARTGLSVERALRKYRLSTVCRSARCPNIFECWGKRRATFLILGDTCTRACRFCAVGQRLKKAAPSPVDEGEPERVALAVRELDIRHVVITSVTREDLPDRGARQFASTMDAVRRIACSDTGSAGAPDSFLDCGLWSADCGVRRTLEVLVPELNDGGVDEVMSRHPDVFGHNVETVPRLYAAVRPVADYAHSLDVLKRSAVAGSGRTRVKSGLMVGLGETFREVVDTLGDLRAAGCGMVTIGQYLRPALQALKVARFVPPEEFEQMEAEARRLGFEFVAAGPFVRSSYLI